MQHKLKVHRVAQGARYKPPFSASPAILLVTPSVALEMLGYLSFIHVDVDGAGSSTATGHSGLVCLKFVPERRHR